MNGNMVRNKGQRGERELCELLLRSLDIEAVTRNLDQVREGGADIMDIPGLAIEVKRQEVLSVNVWWKQAVKQAVDTGRMPVLAYRQNRKPWYFCLPASLIVPGSWDYLMIKEADFIAWLQNFFKNNC